MSDKTCHFKAPASRLDDGVLYYKATAVFRLDRNNNTTYVITDEPSTTLSRGEGEALYINDKLGWLDHVLSNVRKYHNNPDFTMEELYETMPADQAELEQYAGEYVDLDAPKEEDSTPSSELTVGHAGYSESDFMCLKEEDKCKTCKHIGECSHNNPEVQKEEDLLRASIDETIGQRGNISRQRTLSNDDLHQIKLHNEFINNERSRLEPAWRVYPCACGGLYLLPDDQWPSRKHCTKCNDYNDLGAGDVLTYEAGNPCPNCGVTFTRYVHTLESGKDIYVCAGCGAE